MSGNGTWPLPRFDFAAVTCTPQKSPNILLATCKRQGAVTLLAKVADFVSPAQHLMFICLHAALVHTLLPSRILVLWPSSQGMSKILSLSREPDGTKNVPSTKAASKHCEPDETKNVPNRQGSIAASNHLSADMTCGAGTVLWSAFLI